MTKKDFQIQIMFENLNVTMMEMGMCFSLHSFYQTRVRSLSCLVSKSLTESVTAFVETWLRWPLRVKIHATSFALPAIVSFDSPVVDIGTKQKTCCWCRNKKTILLRLVFYSTFLLLLTEYCKKKMFSSAKFLSDPTS